VRALKEKAERALARHQLAIRFLSDTLTLLRSADRRARLRQDVLRPVRARQLGGPAAFEKITAILGTPYPFLTWVEQHAGPVTVGVALQAEAGLAVGASVMEGLSGLRYHCVCHSIGGSVCAGAVAEVDLGAQLSMSLGKPQPGHDVSVEVTVGAGYNATCGVTAAFKPIPRVPTWQDPSAFDYEFKGAAVSLGVGAGFDIGLSVGVTNSTILIGPVP
jgi:hypothetical protein